MIDMMETKGWMGRLGVLAGWTLLLIFFSDPGTFNIDEVHYLLAAHQFSTDGSFLVPNGFAEFRHDVMLFMHPQPLEALPGQRELTTFIPPLYTFPAALLYSLAGIRGLFALNVMGFVIAVMLAMRIVRELVDEAHREAAQWLTLGALIAGSHLSGYAVVIVNHALALALVLGSISLHPVFRQRAKGSTPLLLTLASGLLLGMAFGVRLQHIVTIAVAVLFCLAVPRRPVAHLLALVAGIVPPVLLVSWINHERFESWNPLSYGVSAQARLVPLFGDALSRPAILLAGGLLGLVVLLLAAAGRDRLRQWFVRPGAEQRLQSLAWVAGSLPLVMLIIPPFGGHFAERVVGLFSFAPMDSEWREGVIPMLAVWKGVRTPLLASAPLVLTGLAMPFLLAARELSVRAWMLWAIAWAHLLFVCLLTNNGGYFMSQRYLLEAAVPSLILFAMIVAPVVRQVPQQAWLGGAGVVALAVFLLLTLGTPGRVLGSPPTSLDLLVGRVLPLVIAVAVLVGIAMHAAGKHAGRLVLGLALPASLVVPAMHLAWYDLAHEHEYRRTRRETWIELSKVVPDRSLLIVYGGQREPAARLKTSRDVWVADALRTEWEGVEELLHETSRNGWRDGIYLVSTGMPDEMQQWIVQHARLQRVMEDPFALYRVEALKLEDAAEGISR
jgi:hypothetical protein